MRVRQIVRQIVHCEGEERKRKKQKKLYTMRSSSQSIKLRNWLLHNIYSNLNDDWNLCVCWQKAKTNLKGFVDELVCLKELCVCVCVSVFFARLRNGNFIIGYFRKIDSEALCAKKKSNNKEFDVNLIIEIVLSNGFFHLWKNID